jgi:hypothetical protein
MAQPSDLFGRSEGLMIKAELILRIAEQNPLFHRKWLCANDHDYDLGSIVSPVLR